MEKISIEQMRDIDRVLPKEYGISEESLMEHAGFQVADFIREEFSRNLEFAFICGRGNNGGDGFVAARRLMSWGFDVQVYTPFDSFSGLPGEKKQALEKIDESVFKREFPSANVYIDALLGYGLEGAPHGDVAEAVEKLNKWNAEAVCIDVPTGVDADSGQKLSPHVEADYTVTLGLPKSGLRPENSGEIHVVDIGIPESVLKDLGVDVENYFYDSSRIEIG
jgi:hydroxyethylthiazole kinase-like uncharacterized protein yjeF